MRYTIAFLVAALGCGACGGSESGNGQSDSSSTDSLPDSAAETIADSGSDSGFDIITTYDVVDGGGDCTPPDAPPIFGVATCCNGAPCAGECYEISPGHNECRCFSIPEGCSAPLVCCKVTGGCSDPSLCTGGH